MLEFWRWAEECECFRSGLLIKDRSVWCRFLFVDVPEEVEAAGNRVQEPAWIVLVDQLYHARVDGLPWFASRWVKVRICGEVEGLLTDKSVQIELYCASFPLTFPKDENL